MANPHNSNIGMLMESIINDPHRRGSNLGSGLFIDEDGKKRPGENHISADTWHLMASQNSEYHLFQGNKEVDSPEDNEEVRMMADPVLSGPDTKYAPPK